MLSVIIILFEEKLYSNLHCNNKTWELRRDIDFYIINLFSVYIRLFRTLITFPFPCLSRVHLRLYYDGT